MISVFHSLRFRLALTFAFFGATVSLLLSLGLYFAAHNLGVRLMDETLHAEMEDYISRRARNPNSLPPATASIRGYLLTQGPEAGSVPAELLALDEGIHQLTLGGTPYRIAVVNRSGGRYFMLFSETRQDRREEAFIGYLVSGALIMMMASAWVGWWLAGRVVAPVEELARRVLQASPEGGAAAVALGFRHDEIGQLAQVFSSYLDRMRAFIERERNFTSDVSHELRTPLAIVQGVVELLEEDRQLDAKQQERIAKIARANREMTSLTSALLLMAREDTGEAVAQTCDVCEIAAAVIEMNRHLLNEKTALDFVCRTYPRISAERTLLGIVVANLIRNAFMHTPSGFVSITVDDDSLTVNDSGIGIRGDEIGKVFQQHFKGVGSTGSGIGLSLAKRICERYGWEIIINSTDGKGTSVRLLFSRVPAPFSLDAPLM